jgi:ABC-type bacteriocin/lantibiotic exporter with double-glycine peptidase domain
VIAIFTVLLSLFLVFLVVENTFMFNKSYTNAQKFVLNVPYVKQKPNFCSEASASMVLKYYDYNVSQDEINRMGYDRFENMLPLLKRYVNCTYKSLSIDELQEEIRKNNPVIIRVRAGVSLHTVVVVGYEDDCLLIHDPALGPYIPIKLSLGESFIRAWASTNYSSIIFFEKKQ